MLNKNDAVKGQKAEKLIERILLAHTKPGDIVLDCFSGSGTTAAVAHKMGRQYIVCEQLDEHIDITRRRLIKVINGENSGISKKYNWKGGGSFIYCELASLNQKYIDEIDNAKTDIQLLELYKLISKSDFIAYTVKPKQFEENIEDFENLLFENKKKLLISLLDKNMLYINYSLCDWSSEVCSSDLMTLT